MRTYILAIALALPTASAFAVNTCDTMPTKNQQNDCWSAMIGSEMQDADEYVSAVKESRKVPAAVKQKVKAKRQAITSDANRLCAKDNLGYPENKCYIEQIQKFKDFTYKETAKFDVRDMRLN
ncbi:hypothetical protein [Ralstonia pseudosolanacearum]|uniref:hypothetical protein n=1 Tax=Ralstonia pseudosolanacearum TaxID=1310165 RepID=UPI000AAC1727|nr:hypothetical protein [Ralstonia pseudosolanacearum]MDO3558651.1 hypothetical protein [Ralstonia pseudosolanacearum]MDO3575105.1 hypothetical protein [Ralstonia pseudosolanacearum]MDO3584989.1 hypothetical protein [Ralstonia pseudosolanacearum]